MIGAVIIILAVFALVMLSPVTISINSAKTGDRIFGYFSLHWIMFMFRYALKDRQAEILVLGKQIVRLPRKKKPLQSGERKKYRNIKIRQKMKHIGDIFYISRPILRLLKDLISSFKLKYLAIDIKFGLHDPAYTGIMTGLLHSIQGFLKAGDTVTWTADFTKQVLEWNLKAEAAITPIQIVPPVARFIINGQVLRSGLHIFRD